MFGLGADQAHTFDLIPPTPLALRPGQIVFVTGPSGSGKSTLLRLIAQELAAHDTVRVLDFAALPDPPDAAVIDAVDGGTLPLDRVLRLLSLAGLNDAFVMLRRPAELSDGQRYRFRLAQAISQVETAPPTGLVVVLADEFGATLDRTTAAALSQNIRRWIDQTRDDPGLPGVCFIAATTHDDLLEPLNPETLLEKHLGSGIDVVEADRGH
ncbi:MAG: ATP-binding cassette domain-containing protein [Planctomycetota bacterium]